MSGFVGIGYEPSGKVPVAGTFTGTGQSAAFSPQAGRDFNVWLSGTASETVQLEKSYDGTTWFPIFAGGQQLYLWVYVNTPLVESVNECEAGVTYRLNCTAFTSGTLTYRISQ